MFGTIRKTGQYVEVIWSSFTTISKPDGVNDHKRTFYCDCTIIPFEGESGFTVSDGKLVTVVVGDDKKSLVEV